MRKRLLASLIVCVALLTQLGASFWGATTARDGSVWCHKLISASVALDAQQPGGETGRPAGAPAPHDHASCSLCQLGFSVIDGAAPVFDAQAVKFYSRVALVEPAAPAPRALFNRSASARAPPFKA